MSFTLEDLGKSRTRWVSLPGHLAPMEIEIAFAGSEERQKFVNRLEADGVIKPTRENPLKINIGREGTFFNELAKRYVRDWRRVKAKRDDPEEVPYDLVTMGSILRAYPLAYETLMEEVAKENDFFVNESNGSTPS